MKKHVPTIAERVKIANRLEQVISKYADHCEYTGDHSDAALAKELGVTEPSVRNTRLALYGTLKVPKPVTSKGKDNSAELEALNNKVNVWIGRQQDMALALTHAIMRIDELEGFLTSEGYHVKSKVKEEDKQNPQKTGETYCNGPSFQNR